MEARNLGSFGLQVSVLGLGLPYGLSEACAGTDIWERLQTRVERLP